MELISHAVYLFEQIIFSHEHGLLILSIFHTEADTVDNELCGRDFHDDMIITLESATADRI